MFDVKLGHSCVGQLLENLLVLAVFQASLVSDDVILRIAQVLLEQSLICFLSLGCELRQQRALFTVTIAIGTISYHHVSRKVILDFLIILVNQI